MKLYSNIGKLALISTIVAGAAPVVGTNSKISTLEELDHPHNHQQLLHLEELLQQLAANQEEQTERRRQEQNKIQVQLASQAEHSHKTPHSPKKGVR